MLRAFKNSHLHSSIFKSSFQTPNSFFSNSNDHQSSLFSQLKIQDIMINNSAKDKNASNFLDLIDKNDFKAQPAKNISDFEKITELINSNKLQEALHSVQKLSLEKLNKEIINLAMNATSKSNFKSFESLYLFLKRNSLLSKINAPTWNNCLPRFAKRFSSEFIHDIIGQLKASLILSEIDGNFINEWLIMNSSDQGFETFFVLIAAWKQSNKGKRIQIDSQILLKKFKDQPLVLLKVLSNLEKRGISFKDSKNNLIETLTPVISIPGTFLDFCKVLFITESTNFELRLRNALLNPKIKEEIWRNDLLLLINNLPLDELSHKNQKILMVFCSKSQVLEALWAKSHLLSEFPVSTIMSTLLQTDLLNKSNALVKLEEMMKKENIFYNSSDPQVIMNRVLALVKDEKISEAVDMFEHMYLAPLKIENMKKRTKAYLKLMARNLHSKGQLTQNLQFLDSFINRHVDTIDSLTFLSTYDSENREDIGLQSNWRIFSKNKGDIDLFENSYSEKYSKKFHPDVAFKMKIQRMTEIMTEIVTDYDRRIVSLSSMRPASTLFVTHNATQVTNEFHTFIDDMIKTEPDFKEYFQYLIEKYPIEDYKSEDFEDDYGITKKNGNQNSAETNEKGNLETENSNDKILKTEISTETKESNELLIDVKLNPISPIRLPKSDSDDEEPDLISDEKVEPELLKYLYNPDKITYPKFDPKVGLDYDGLMKDANEMEEGEAEYWLEEENSSEEKSSEPLSDLDPEIVKALEKTDLLKNIEEHIYAEGLGDRPLIKTNETIAEKIAQIIRSLQYKAEGDTRYEDFQKQTYYGMKPLYPFLEEPEKVISQITELDLPDRINSISLEANVQFGNAKNGGALDSTKIHENNQDEMAKFYGERNWGETFITENPKREDLENSNEEVDSDEEEAISMRTPNENYLASLENYETPESRIVHFFNIAFANEVRRGIKVLTRDHRDVLKMLKGLVSSEKPEEFLLSKEFIDWGMKNEEPLAVKMGERVAEALGQKFDLELSSRINQFYRHLNSAGQAKLKLSNASILPVNRANIFHAFESHTICVSDPKKDFIARQLCRNPFTREKGKKLLYSNVKTKLENGIVDPMQIQREKAFKEVKSSESRI